MDADGTVESIIIDGNGDLIILDEGTELFRVDKLTGAETLITYDGFLESATDVSLKLTDYVVTIDDGSLILVDSSTGVQTVLSVPGVIFASSKTPTTNALVSGGSSSQTLGPNAPTTDVEVSSVPTIFTSVSDTFTDSAVSTPGSFVKRVTASTDDAEQSIGSGSMD